MGGDLTVVLTTTWARGNVSTQGGSGVLWTQSLAVLAWPLCGALCLGDSGDKALLSGRVFVGVSAREAPQYMRAGHHTRRCVQNNATIGTGARVSVMGTSKLVFGAGSSAVWADNARLSLSGGAGVVVSAGAVVVLNCNCPGAVVEASTEPSGLSFLEISGAIAVSALVAACRRCVVTARAGLCLQVQGGSAGLLVGVRLNVSGALTVSSGGAGERRVWWPACGGMHYSRCCARPSVRTGPLSGGGALSAGIGASISLSAGADLTSMALAIAGADLWLTAGVLSVPALVARSVHAAGAGSRVMLATASVTTMAVTDGAVVGRLAGVHAGACPGVCIVASDSVTVLGGSVILAGSAAGAPRAGLQIVATNRVTVGSGASLAAPVVDIVAADVDISGSSTVTSVDLGFVVSGVLSVNSSSTVAFVARGTARNVSVSGAGSVTVGGPLSMLQAPALAVVGLSIDMGGIINVTAWSQVTASYVVWSSGTICGGGTATVARAASVLSSGGSSDSWNKTVGPRTIVVLSSSSTCTFSAGARVTMGTGALLENYGRLVISSPPGGATATLDAADALVPRAIFANFGVLSLPSGTSVSIGVVFNAAAAEKPVVPSGAFLSLAGGCYTTTAGVWTRVTFGSAAACAVATSCAALAVPTAPGTRLVCSPALAPGAVAPLMTVCNTSCVGGYTRLSGTGHQMCTGGSVWTGGSSSCVAPVVFSVSPSAISTHGGDTITILGAYFGASSAVASAAIEVGGMPCSGTTWISSTELRCASPAGVGASVSVVVLVQGQRSSGGPVLRYKPPSIFSVSAIPTFGGVAVISGSNFAPVGFTTQLNVRMRVRAAHDVFNRARGVQVTLSQNASFEILPPARVLAANETSIVFQCDCVGVGVIGTVSVTVADNPPSNCEAARACVKIAGQDVAVAVVTVWHAPPTVAALSASRGTRGDVLEVRGAGFGASFSGCASLEVQFVRSNGVGGWGRTVVSYARLLRAGVVRLRDDAPVVRLGVGRAYSLPHFGRRPGRASPRPCLRWRARVLAHACVALPLCRAAAAAGAAVGASCIPRWCDGRASAGVRVRPV